MIALVTGANGCVGSALLRELTESGDYADVRALIRDSNAAADLPPGVSVVAGDLADADALRRAATGATVVFHCAAKVHDAHGAEADFQRVNVEGTRRLLDACAAASDAPPRVVHCSTVAVYGDETPRDGLPEDAPLRPATAYARSKVEAERLVSGWGREVGVPVVNLRLATVYGPRDRGNIARMIDTIVRGQYLTIGNGQNRKTFVAVRNVARAARLTSLPDADAVVAGRPLVVADPRPYTLREIELSVRLAAGIMRTGWTIPTPVALLLAGILERMTKPGRKPPITRAQVRRLAAHNVYHAETLPLIPGYVPPVATLDEGMAEAVAWYRKQERGSSS